MLAAPRPCRHPGCRQLTSDGQCDAHRKQAQREQDQRRGSAASRGYDSKWKIARAYYLRKHPLCVGQECKADHRVTPATVVDHIIPHKGDKQLFWDSDNWQPLCKPCHDAKTAREDGGFGRAVSGMG